MEKLTRQQLIADHAPGGKHNPAKPLGPAGPDAWWLERNRFGNKAKVKVKVTWEDGKPIFGDTEYHIYRQQIHRKRGAYGDVVKGKGLPEYITSVWGQEAMKAAMAAAKKEGHRVFQLTTRLDGEDA